MAYGGCIEQRCGLAYTIPWWHLQCRLPACCRLMAHTVGATKLIKTSDTMVLSTIHSVDNQVCADGAHQLLKPIDVVAEIGRSDHQIDMAVPTQGLQR